MTSAHRFVFAAAVASLLSWAGGAAANGKFPAADQLVVDPGNPLHLAVRTTFGILTSINGGADWDLICEAAAGYENAGGLPTSDPGVGGGACGCEAAGARHSPGASLAMLLLVGLGAANRKCRRE